MDPGLSAVIRVGAFAIWGVLLGKTLIHDRRRGPSFTTRTYALAGAWVMLAAVALAGTVQALGIPVAPGLLTTLYTFAALIAAAIGGFWIIRGR